jgi:hypothetical protein
MGNRGLEPLKCMSPLDLQSSAVAAVPIAHKRRIQDSNLYRQCLDSLANYSDDHYGNPPKRWRQELNPLGYRPTLFKSASHRWALHQEKYNTTGGNS